MNAPETAAGHALQLTRTLSAPPAEVYAAWLDPAQIRRWMGDADYPVTEVVVEARVGGRYRIAVTAPDGGVHLTVGEYRELVPGKRLVKTWVYEGPHPAADRGESLLTVELREAGPGVTELTLRHERISTAGGGETLREGWIGCLDQMAALFAPANAPAAAPA